MASLGTVYWHLVWRLLFSNIDLWIYEICLDFNRNMLLERFKYDILTGKKWWKFIIISIYMILKGVSIVLQYWYQGKMHEVCIRDYNEFESNNGEDNGFNCNGNSYCYIISICMSRCIELVSLLLCVLFDFFPNWLCVSVRVRMCVCGCGRLHVRMCVCLCVCVDICT